MNASPNETLPTVPGSGTAKSLSPFLLFVVLCYKAPCTESWRMSDMF